MGADPPSGRMNETQWRTRAVVIAVIVTATSCTYLTQVSRVSQWRDVPLAIAFVVAETFGVITFVSLCWSVTRVRRRPHRLARAVPVDVFIPTLDETLEILEPTVRAALALEWQARVRVFVLDDGDRPEVAALAERLGVKYLTRAEHNDAKAGNLNAALAATAHDDPAPVIAVFDADQVAVPDFLTRTVGHLDDDDVVLVQTPQYYRLDGTRAVRVAAEQQLLLCDVIAPSRDGFNTMFCMGTNYVVERTALDRIGGYAAGFAEDVMTSLELMRIGARIAYVHEPLAVGLAPPTLSAFVKQQTRWTAGALELLTRRRDLWRQLSPLALWHYATLPFGALYGITFPIYIGLVLLNVAFGWQPFQTTPPLFMATQLLWAVTGGLGLWLTVRGTLHLDALLVRWGSFAITFRALKAVATPRRTPWEVSQKIRRPGEPDGSAHYLRVSAVIVAATVGALALRGYQASLFIPLLVSGSNALALLAIALRFRNDDARRLPAERMGTGDDVRAIETRRD